MGILPDDATQTKLSVLGGARGTRRREHVHMMPTAHGTTLLHLNTAPSPEPECPHQSTEAAPSAPPRARTKAPGTLAYTASGWAWRRRERASSLPLSTGSRHSGPTRNSGSPPGAAATAGRNQLDPRLAAESFTPPMPRPIASPSSPSCRVVQHSLRGGMMLPSIESAGKQAPPSPHFRLQHVPHAAEVSSQPSYPLSNPPLAERLAVDHVSSRNFCLYCVGRRRGLPRRGDVRPELPMLIFAAACG